MNYHKKAWSNLKCILPNRKTKVNPKKVYTYDANYLYFAKAELWKQKKS